MSGVFTVDEFQIRYSMAKLRLRIQLFDTRIPRFLQKHGKQGNDETHGDEENQRTYLSFNGALSPNHLQFFFRKVVTVK